MNYTLSVPKGTPLHERLVKKVSSRIKLAEKGQRRRFAEWKDAEDRTLAFLPETEKDRARRDRRTKGTPTYTTIQIPYSYALLMSAHTYWTSVFFARSPVHQFSGRHGEGEQQIQAMEALIDYQTMVGRMLAPYYLWFYDAGKYGCGILGTYWDRQKLHYGELVEMQMPNGKTQLMQTTREIPGYIGNCAYNVSPWDFMSDPRKPLKDFQKGEFCCARKKMGWNDIVRRRDAGYFNDNVKFLRERASNRSGREEGSEALERPEFDTMLWGDIDNSEVQHPAGCIFWEFYVDLIPSEWGVGNTKYPQKWCITITEDLELIVGASPLNYVHCEFPFDVLEPEIEGYGTYVRGIPKIMAGVQDTMDWLINTHFFNVRASINNQFIVDPSKLVIKDVKNSGPGFIWRLRPEAYGTDLTKMFLQVPVQDVTRAHMTDFNQMFPIGERVLGINDQIMGSLSGPGRKTATEVRTTTGFGVNRLKTVSEYMSAAGFAPHSFKLVQNSQQFYDAEQKLRRVGSLAQEAGMNFIMVTPEDIKGQFDFVPVDGVLPIDRMAQANLWKEMMGNLRMMPPQVAMGYDWMRIFAWVANLAGLKNIQQFKIQIAPDALLQAQAQQGNVIPMPGRGPQLPGPPGGGSPVEPGNAASTAAGLNALAGEAA